MVMLTAITSKASFATALEEKSGRDPWKGNAKLATMKGYFVKDELGQGVESRV